MTFSVETTEDGSPTLRLPDNGESMHHSGGAATETNYIYRQVIARTLENLPHARLLVVGLGLGYIEICWAMEVLRLGLESTSTSCRSYEVDEGLIERFLEWINGGESALYDQVCSALDSGFAVSDIKRVLRKNFSADGIYVDLLTYAGRNERYHIICYDAFSRKTSGPLWTEEFLSGFLAASSESDCVLTTYAATANLNRALKANGFLLHQRAGFKGKRESTLAGRGCFSSFDFYRIS